MTHIVHPIEPVFDASSEILILGSFPSVKSREQMFFYGHPQNRFWKVIAAVFEETVPQTVAEKKSLLHRRHIAVWDVIYSCDIQGSADSSIRGVIPTDLKSLIVKTQVRHVYCNGKTAGNYYQKYQQEKTGITATVLPSTSPANAAWNLEKLVAQWQQIRMEKETEKR